MLWYPKKSAFRAGTVSSGNPTYWDDANVGTYSFAGGLDCEATGANSFCFGNNSTATASDAVSMGRNTFAGGGGAVALGAGFTFANGYGSFAIAGAHANSTESIAIGGGSLGGANTNGVRSIAIGNVTTDGDYSIAFGTVIPAGIYPTASGASSVGFFLKDQSGSAVSGTGSMGIFLGGQSGTPVTVAANNAMVILGGNVGIGTTAPSAPLDVKGHVANSGLAATVGACGTTPSITGNDNRGSVTNGSGIVTSCVVTFNSAYTTNPFCVVSWSGAAAPTTGISSVATTTTLTVYFSASSGTAVFNYHCTQ